MNLFQTQKKLMGSAFSLGVLEDSEYKAGELLEMGIIEIERLEKLLSEFLQDSETSKINKNAWKQPLLVDKECFQLIERCRDISNLTNGDFDITVKPLKSLYRFKNANFEMPNKMLIKKTLKSVGYQKIKIDRKNDSVQLNHPNTNISFSAIGKGYASDRVKQLWQKNGVQSGYINASGDLNAFGNNAEDEPWKVAIANPDDKIKVLMYVPLKNASVATSGDYEQHFTWQGKRYSHNINPLTGLPLTGIKSVSVFSPSAELSDALATAVYVKGVRKGLDFINQLPQTHCIIIDENNDVNFSKDLKYEVLAF